MPVKISVLSASGALVDVAVELDRDITCAELAQDLEQIFGPSPAPLSLAYRGRPIPPGRLLGTKELRSGSIIELGPGGLRVDTITSVLQLRVLSGPDCGASVVLPRGTHTVGRSAAEADIVINDLDISRRHLRLTVDSTSLFVQDLSSTNGTTVDGRPIGDEPTVLELTSQVLMGNSVLAVVGAPEPPAAVHADADGAIVVNRSPRIRQQDDCPSIDFPAPPSAPARPRAQWVAALLPTLFAVGLALTMHSPEFLAFALLTPITLLATAASDRWEWRRGRRRTRAEYLAAEQVAEGQLQLRLAEEVLRRRSDYPDAAAVAHSAAGPDWRLWERRLQDPDFLFVRLGVADQPAHVVARRGTQLLAPRLLCQVPVVLSLAAGPLGIAGPAIYARGAARWLISQLVVEHSPNDVRLTAIVNEQSQEWLWLRWLPALSAVAETPQRWQDTVAELVQIQAQRRAQLSTGQTSWSGPWIVVLVEPARLIAQLPGLQALVEDGSAVGITAVCLDDDRRLLPPFCRSLVQFENDTGSMLSLTVAGAVAQPNVTAERVSVTWADNLARNLTPLRDSGFNDSTELPSHLSLRDLMGLSEMDPESLTRRWAGQHSPSGADGPSAADSPAIAGRPVVAGSLAVPVGWCSAGPMVIDLAKDGPHALVAGSTGSGKSEFLRTLVSALATNNSPQSVTFLLVDYKGGAAFSACASFPHTVALVTDLDSHLTRRALTSLHAELRRRERILSDAGATDLDEYLAAEQPHLQPVPRLVLVVDEFAALAEEFPEFLSGLIGIAQRGRSLGVHLILATQRPAGVVSPEIKANMALRIALRMTEPNESADVIGTGAAASISKNLPGRGYARVADGLIEFQAARIGLPVAELDRPRIQVLDGWHRTLVTEPDGRNPDKLDLHLLSDAAREASARSGCPLPQPPWLPPLTAHVHTKPDDDAGSWITLALLDRPAEQRQDWLKRDLASGGSLAFIGAARSGRTSALRLIAAQATQQLPPDQCHLYAIDCGGGSLAGLAQLPHCGSVAQAAEWSLIPRLLQRLSAELTKRQEQLAELGAGDLTQASAAGLQLPAIVVLIDDWEGLVGLSEEMDAGRTTDLVLRLLRASAAGVTFALSGDRSLLGARTASAIGDKYLLRMVERSDYAMAGINPREVPTEMPPGRMICAADGAEAQLATLSGDATSGSDIAALAAVGQRWRSPASGGPFTLAALPTTIGLRTLTEAAWDTQSATMTILGAGGDQANAVGVDLSAFGGRFLIAGPPRSGRSTAAITVAHQAWLTGIRVITAGSVKSPLTEWAARHDVPHIGPTSDIDVHSGCDLLIIDDAEQFNDTVSGDKLLEVVNGGESAIVACCRTEELMLSFRGIGVAVRRGRRGLLLHPTVADGELLGIRVPAQRMSSPPGRGLLVAEEISADYPAGMPIQLAFPDLAGR